MPKLRTIKARVDAMPVYTLSAYMAPVGQPLKRYEVSSRTKSMTLSVNFADKPATAAIVNQNCKIEMDTPAFIDKPTLQRKL